LLLRRFILQGRQEGDDDGKQGKEKAGKDPEQDVPALLCSDQAADGSCNYLKDNKTAHRGY
jgi:hypothetical protein